jgi:predicted RNA polymerase sigma factor
VTGPADPAGVLDRLWRADHAGMLGVPACRLSDLERAEDALQEAAGEALRRWPDDGVPAIRRDGW